MFKTIKITLIVFAVAFLAWILASTLQIALRADITQPVTANWNYFNVIF